MKKKTYYNNGWYRTVEYEDWQGVCEFCDRVMHEDKIRNERICNNCSRIEMEKEIKCYKRDGYY